jgi:hypothetical protein
MGYVEDLKGSQHGHGRNRWRARWRDPAGRQRTKSFARKIDAERFLLGVEDAKLRGAYVDPAAGRVNFGEWAERWYKTTAGLKPSTRHTYRQLLDYQILPTFQKATLAGIDTLLVREWLAALVQSELSPSRIRNAHQVLSQVLATAVEANRLARNPAKGVRLPRIARREMHFLTAAQVEQLAAAIAAPFPLLVASTPTPACEPASWPPCGSAAWTCSVGAAKWSSPPPRSPTSWCGERPRPMSGARCGCPDSCVSSSPPTWPTGPTRPATWCSPCRRAGRCGSRSSPSATSSPLRWPPAFPPPSGSMTCATPARAC